MKRQIIEDTSNRLFSGIEQLIERTSRNVAVHLNTEISCLYWSIGNHIITEMGFETYSQQGRQILATLSQTLSWSHFIELVAIENPAKRLFYQQMCVIENISARSISEL